MVGYAVQKKPKETEFEKIHRQGLKLVESVYLKAVAADVRGDKEKSKKLWVQYGEILSQVLTLTVLHGEVVAYVTAKRAGLEWDVTDFPDEKPKTFAKTTIGFGVGDFWAAIWGFKKKIPNSWKTIQRARKEMDELSKKIAKAESANALKDISKRIETLQQVLNGSFVVKGATREQARKLKSLLADAITHKKMPEGLRRGGMAKFITRAQVEGIVGMTAARLETVYRTNVSSAYNNATATVLENPALQIWAPLVKLVEIHDRRTRGAPNGVYAAKGKTSNTGYHWQMNGYVQTADLMKSQGLIPPNGYNCRGGLIPFTKYDAEKLGLLNSNGTVSQAKLNAYNGIKQTIIDQKLYPDEGFKR